MKRAVPPIRDGSVRDGGPVVSSRIERFGDRPSNDSDRYARDSVYLISPLACWDGGLWIDERPVHQGSIRPGMLRLASSLHTEKRTYPTDARALVIRIPESRLNDMLGHLDPDTRPDHFQPEGITHGDPKVRCLVGVLARERLLSTGARTLLTAGVCEALLGLLIEHSRDPRKQGVSAVHELTSEQMQISSSFVHERLHRPPSIESWARRLSLGKDEFAKRFSRTYGITPYAWLMEQRIKRAKSLLRETEDAPSTIALQLGFADQSHFTDTFSRRVGMSPVRWRMEQRLPQKPDRRSASE